MYSTNYVSESNSPAGLWALGDAIPMTLGPAAVGILASAKADLLSFNLLA